MSNVVLTLGVPKHAGFDREFGDQLRPHLLGNGRYLVTASGLAAPLETTKLASRPASSLRRSSQVVEERASLHQGLVVAAADDHAVVDDRNRVADPEAGQPV